MLKTLLIILIFLLNLNCWAQLDEETLFEQVFKQSPTQIKPSLQEIPFFINQFYIGEAQAQFYSFQTISFIKIANLSPKLDDLVTKELLLQLKELESDGKITPQELTALGIRHHFDETNFRYYLYLPPRVLKAKKLELINHPDSSPDKDTLLPQPFSAYLNTHLNQQINTKYGERLYADLEAAIRYEKVLLEMDGLYDTSEEKTFQRNDFRFIYDQRPQGVRYQLGDLIYPVSSYMVFKNLGGLAAHRDYSLTPYDTIYPTGRYQFVLKRKAKVYVLVNGNLNQILSLNPGKYDLTNFPLNPGINQVTLKIVKDDGTVETLDFTLALDAENLKEGTHQFSYVAGYPYDDLAGERKYHFDQGTHLSLWHRYGVNDIFTLGGFSQYDPDQYIIGSDQLLATMVGSFRLEEAFSSLSESGQSGVSTRLSYEFFNYSEKSGKEKQFDLFYSYRSPHFATWNTTQALNPFRHNLGVSYRQGILSNLSIGLSSDYSHSVNPDYTSLWNNSLSFDYRPWRYINCSVNFMHNRDRFNEWETGVALFATINFDYHHNINVFHNSPSQTTNLFYNTNVETPAGRVLGQINELTSKQFNEQQGRLELQNSRFIAYADVKRRDAKEREVNYQANTGLSFAMVTTGKNFSFARPINGSFAIISPHPSLEDEKVKANPEIGVLSASNDLDDDLVLTSLTPYQIGSVNIDDSEVSYGKSLSENFYKVFPYYKSGHLIKIGSEAQVSLSGTIYQNGKPLKLTTGELKNIKTQESNLFFTNKQGIFFIEQIKSGTYQLITQDGKSKSFEVSESETGLTNLGEVNVE